MCRPAWLLSAIRACERRPATDGYAPAAGRAAGSGATEMQWTRGSMQDNRFAPPPHSANAPGDEVGAAGKGVASRSPQLASGGVPSTATPGAGGRTPGGTQIDAAGGAQPDAQERPPNARNTPRDSPARHPTHS